MIGLQRPIHSKEHTNSYYAATAQTIAYPRLENELSTDVVVIGGGFSGVNTALELSERGIRVVLLEANRIAWGATGRNGGQLIGGLGHDPDAFTASIGPKGVALVHDLGVECVDIVRERVAQYDIDCDLRWGYCEVALKPRHLRELEETQRSYDERSYPHETQLLSKAELKKFIGTDAYLGGLFDPTGAGHLHPLKLCQGEAQAAAALGAQIFEHSKVERVEQGKRARLVTERGSVSADHVVFCGNGYLDNLVPTLATKLIPASSCIITTEPLSLELANSVLPQNTAVCDMRTVLDYYRLTPERRMLFGGLANYSGLLPPNYAQTLQKRMTTLFPQLENCAIDYAWDGQMGISMNRMPQVGQLDNGHYFIQAFSGHGVAPTHALARLVAEAICGDTSRFKPLASIPHRRFPGGRYLRTPVMAAGMLYFRGLDLL